MSHLLSNLVRPIVYTHTYDDIRHHFGLAPDIDKDNYVDRLLRINELLEFDRNNSAKLSLITREEIGYIIYSSYSVMMEPYLSVPITGMNDAMFQRFQTLSIYILRNNLPKTQTEITVRETLFTTLTNAVTHRTVNEERYFAILDVFLHSCPNDELRRQLEIELNEHRMRQQEMRVRETAIQKYTSKYEISTDSQNVHDSIINTLYRRKLLVLSTDVIPEESPKKTVEKYQSIRSKYKTATDKLRNIFSPFGGKHFAFDRILTDYATYGSSGLTLGTIFQRVFYRVMRCEGKDFFPDLLQRIEDECLEMQTTCNTGHMMRLLNILNGYPEIDIEVVTFYVDEVEKSIRTDFEEEHSENDALMESYISFGDERKPFEDYCKLNIIKWYTKYRRYYVLEKQTHSDFLYKEDFLEAYNKFSGLKLTHSDLKMDVTK